MKRHLLPFAAAAGLTAFSIVTALAQHHAPEALVAASQQHGSGHDTASTSATAAPVKAGDLTISGGWLKAMLPGQPAGGGYLTISNGGASADRLIAVSTAAAAKAEVHEMKIENNVMTMRPVTGGLEIPPGATVELKPGGFHLMFLQVAKRFEDGATVAVTLEFEKAGKVEVTLPVKKGGGGH